jgi:transposase
MSNARVAMHRLQELVRLHRMKTGPREVARLLTMSPNTERTYRSALLAAGLLEGPVDELPELVTLRAAVLAAKPEPAAVPPQSMSSLEPWREEITALLPKLGPRGIYDRLRLEHPEFPGSHSAVKRLYQAIQRARGVTPAEVAIPVETAPGQIAQVDFGYLGYLIDPQSQLLRRAWCFVLVLGYSRHMVARVVFDQKTDTWLQLHIEAFVALGGVPLTLVPDNLKAAVLRAAFGLGDDPALNRSYRELARHYHCMIDPTPPYDPRKKGKVESGVKYIRRNFFPGREGQPLDEVQRALDEWVRVIAGTRDHGTTHRAPLTVFAAEEQPALQPLPTRSFEPVAWHRVTVHPDCHVCFQRRLYSVPWRFTDKQRNRLWVRATVSTVAILTDDDVRVATHSRRGPGYRSTIEEHLPEGRRDLRHRSRDYWEQRATAVGVEVGEYIREVFDADEVLSQLRTVQAMVTHLEGFPANRARAACERARYYGNYSYAGLKNILKKALDLEPLPAAVLPPQELVAPRFARNLSELLELPLEVTDEPH